MSEKVSIILPTYNEEPNIALLIDEIKARLSLYSFEILVIDDTSTDHTYKEALNSANDNIKVFLHTPPRSLARSIKYGLENTAGDIVIVMDSDFNHNPEYLPKMIAALQQYGYDAVFASRFLPGGGVKNPVHQFLSMLFNLFVRIMLKNDVRDNLYGFFAIKRTALDKINYNKVFWGYGDYCMRLIHYLQRTDSKIIEIPAMNGTRKGGRRHHNILKVFWQYFTAVISFSITIRRDHV